MSKNEKIWKQNCSPLICYFGHVKCSSSIPVEKLAKKLKTSRSLSKNDEKIHLFSESVFYSKCFYRHEECSFDRPVELFLLNYRKWSEKSSTKMQKLFTNVFFKLFPWRGRKQLESLADFFRTASRKFSARYSEKEQFVIFRKKFHPKVSIETENPVLTTPLLFLRKMVKKLLSVQKWEKKLEIKLFFVKMSFWTRKMQF